MRRTYLATLAAAVMTLGAAGPAAASSTPRVGHAVESLSVTGSALQEQRQVGVHVWYPARRQKFERRPLATYTSGLHGLPLASPWAALSWTVQAELAREEASITRRDRRLPVIVFSHGSVNDPIDYAYTLERIAGAGFVVAAPAHVNNTQDDVRIDFANSRAGAAFPCRDGRPSPCSRPSVAFSMADRVRDISAVLDALPGWLGRPVDTERAGVMGHSRGTVTALAAAGGSAPRTENPNCQPDLAQALCWPLEADPRVAAVMGMAIGAMPITSRAGLANVSVPTVLVAGALDRTSLPAVSQFAFEQIPSTEKSFVLVENATHRSFDSTYCAQTQAAGAIALSDPNAILDRHTFDGIAATLGTSGRAVEYCDLATFTEPVDIRPLVPDFPAEVPTTGLDTEQVERQMADLAVRFFGESLGVSRSRTRP